MCLLFLLKKPKELFDQPDTFWIGFGVTLGKFCDLVDHSQPGSSVHGIFSAAIVEWVAIPFSRDLPNPGIVPGSPALQADALLSKPPGKHASVQFSSVAQLCPTLCDPMNCSRPGLPVHHHLPESTQTHIHGISDLMDVSLSELQDMVMDKEAWHAAIHGVTKNRTRLSDWTELII